MDTIRLETLLDDVGKAHEFRDQPILDQDVDGRDGGVLGELPDMQLADL
jgi:hypothetical protein